MCEVFTALNLDDFNEISKKLIFYWDVIISVQLIVMFCVDDFLLMLVILHMCLLQYYRQK